MLNDNFKNLAVPVVAFPFTGYVWRITSRFWKLLWYWCVKWNRYKTKQILPNNFIQPKGIMRVTLLLFLFIIRPSNSLSRLNFFLQHHNARSTICPSTTRQSGTHIWQKSIQRKLMGLKRICSAKTCSKCLKLLYSRPGKLQKSCKILVGMPACCPHNVFFPNGF